jgi:uncharacterized damage-inducible protein DinB
MPHPAEVHMKMTELFGAQLKREAKVSRRVLERVPEGRPDYKPHEKSMPLGYLCTLVASMPSWIALAITQDELDINPPGGSKYRPKDVSTNRELIAMGDDAVTKARAALEGATDEHLLTRWKLLVAGRVVAEDPRHVVIADTFTHLAHHRGQLTVYLRLNGALVPSVYGPSADDRGFASS